MKMLFCIAAVLSLSFAFGQRDDFFDANEYLKKKNNKKGKAIFDPFVRERLGWCGNPWPNQTIQGLLNSNDVITLPQDNMPCVVPDMNQFNMPVLKPPATDYTIPNPAIPPAGNKPPVQAEEQLKQWLEKQKSKSSKPPVQFYFK
ncbi:MAG: hypothetical protein JNN00_13715 [Chitinophagaceae bacterium]|nr:hypothetical protein [Chitinophagaceae bacterium]